LKSNPQPIISSLIRTASSAFHPIISTQNVSSTTKIKSQHIPMDIPKHKPLERGQKLTKVHISHPQSPSIVHVNSIFIYFLINNTFSFSLCYMKILIQLVVYFIKWQHIQIFNQIMYLVILLSMFYLVSILIFTNN
jgi:hypothetical protein